jgi:DNA-3-methyladenine glycosylase I
MLTLEGAQAGLSWLTVLKKRQGYRTAFFDWDIDRIAIMTEDEKALVLATGNIIRNKLKVNSTVTNAQAAQRLRDSHGGLDAFLWSYVDNSPIRNQWQSHTEVPARTELSDQISKDMKKLGFKFVGGTIMYAYMQAIGMVNDHTVDCDRYHAV